MYTCTVHVYTMVWPLLIDFNNTCINMKIQESTTCMYIHIGHLFSFIKFVHNVLMYIYFISIFSSVHLFIILFNLLLFLTESSLSILCLHPTIQRKLGMALNNLQPMDYSPHVILKPWIKVSWGGGLYQLV